MTWSVPIVFLSVSRCVLLWFACLNECPVHVYSSSLLCEKIEPLLVTQNSPVKLEFFSQHCHHVVKWEGSLMCIT